MKKLITNYTFDPTAKTIVFTDYDSIDLSQVLLVTNTTDNIIIYNFACIGGTVTGNTLTLAYDTSAMDSGDSLQIYYDDVELDSISTNQEIMMAQLVNQLLLVLGNTAGAGSNALSVDVRTFNTALPQNTTLGAVTTVTTLGTMNNQLAQGGVSSFLTAQYLSDAYTYNYLNNVTFS